MAGSLKLFLSGGVGNADPALSIGGAKSTTRLYSETVAYAGSSISGVTLIDGALNSPGTGQLKFVFADKTLSWKPPGASAFEKYTTVTGVNGKIIPIRQLISDPGGAILMVTVVEASFPGADATVDVTVSKRTNNLLPDVTKEQSQTGLTRYRGIYVENESNVAFKIAVSVPINSQGNDVIAAGWAVEGGDLQMQQLVHDYDVPTGVAFFYPTDYENEECTTLLLGPGDYHGLWIRQRVPVLNPYSKLSSVVNLRFKLYI
jgi:hypothetical protein